MYEMYTKIYTEWKKLKYLNTKNKNQYIKCVVATIRNGSQETSQSPSISAIFFSDSFSMIFWSHWIFATSATFSASVYANQHFLTNVEHIINFINICFETFSPNQNRELYCALKNLTTKSFSNCSSSSSSS